MKTKTALFTIALVLISNISILSQNKTNNAIIKEKYNTNKAFEDSIGYAEAVKVGNTIYVSGVVGWGNMDDALKLAYDQIDKILKNYGATYQNVIKENLYTTALDSVIKHKDVRRSYYNNDFPAATWVEVKRLFNEGLVVEVEVIAQLPE